MKRFSILLVLLLVSSTTALAQRGIGQRGQDPIAANLFSAELVMQHQEAIGLTDTQRRQVREAALEAETQFASLRWDMREATQGLQKLVTQDRLEETEVLAQLDTVLDFERAIKRVQAIKAVRIKNVLTPEQQQQLRTLRRGQSG